MVVAKNTQIFGRKVAPLAARWVIEMQMAEQVITWNRLLHHVYK